MNRDKLVELSLFPANSAVSTGVATDSVLW